MGEVAVLATFMNAEKKKSAERHRISYNRFDQQTTAHLF